MDTQTCASGAATPEAINVSRKAGSDEPGTAILTCSALRRISEINAEHRLATGCAKDAVQHAIRCGTLLLEAKAELRHGELTQWIGLNCEFAYSTASRYMTAARANLSGVEISSLTGLFPSGRKPKLNKAAVMPPAAEGRKVSDRLIESGSGLMTGAPSSRGKPDIAVDDAIRLLTAKTDRYLINAVRNARGQVTKFENKLLAAKKELARAEAAVIKAATELQQP